MENLLEYNYEADSFGEALPMGNGSLGAMIYGKAKEDKITLNHETLWSGKAGNYTPENPYKALVNAKKLVIDGEIKRAEEEIENGFLSDWAQSYQPMSELYIKSDERDVDVYRRTLDLNMALSEVAFHSKKGETVRSYFVSQPDNVLVVHNQSSEAHDYEIYLISKQLFEIKSQGNMLVLEGECPSFLLPGDHLNDTPCIADGEGIKFTNAVAINSDGKVFVAGSRIYVKNAKEFTLYLCCETSFVSFNKKSDAETFDKCVKRVESLLKQNYSDIKAAHIKDYQTYYNRVTLQLNSAKVDMFTDERIKSEEKDIGLCELMFNYGRYLLISSSRPGTMATNLQGIWNEDVFPPWCSCYTLNINTEMNYWPALMCNLTECNLPIISLIEMLAESGRKTAEKYYNAKGFVCHSVSDLWGKTSPIAEKFSNSCHYAFWNMSPGWLCSHLFAHFEYTQDLNFLKMRAMPIIEGAIEFYLSQLDEIDGKLVMFPSTSPENRYKLEGVPLAVAKSTAMSQGILYELFSRYISVCEDIGNKGELYERVSQAFEKLDMCHIGKDGRILEWDSEVEENDPTHRHMSHLYGVFPGQIFTPEKNTELYKAGLKSLIGKGDESTGWSMAWKANLWARYKDGNKVWSVIKKGLRCTVENKIAYRGGCYANLLGAHPPFQIDSNFGITSAIAQMFLQYEDGKIKLLPALCDELKSGSIKGLVARGNVTVNIFWKDGVFESTELTTKIPQNICVFADGKYAEIEADGKSTYLINNSKDTLNIKMVKEGACDE